MRVAFLGLGIMGRPMAANLVKAGHEVSVWSRTAGKEVEGARSATSPADAARGAEVVWMCVSDTQAVESVLFGPAGGRGSAGRGHDRCRLQHHFALGDPQVRRTGGGAGCALRGRAHDRIEGRGRSRQPHFHRRRRRSGDRVA